MTQIFWTSQSLEDLEAIRAYIARNAPRTADLFVERIIRAVDSLRLFPLSGATVEALRHHDLREVFVGNYRIIYRGNESRVSVLAIYHAARLLDERRF